MSRNHQILQSHTYQYMLASMLFIVAMMGILSACGSNAPSSPVKGPPGVYVGRQDGLVDALKPGDGSFRWHQQLDKQFVSNESLIVFNNIVYVGRTIQACSADCRTSSKVIGSIDALNTSNGALLWQSKVDVHNDVTETVNVMKVVNDVIYVAVDSVNLGQSPADVYALRASDGSQIWHYSVSGRCCRGLVVTDTAIYVGELDHVDAIKTSDRTLLWHHQIDRPSVLVGIAAVDGVVYIGTALIDYSGPPKGSVDALRTSDGSVLWHSQTNFASFVLTVADGIVYVGAFADHTLDALRVSDGSLLWQYQSDRSVYQATVMNGVAYLTSACVFCYKDNGSAVDAVRVSDGSHLWRYNIDPESVTDPQALQVAVGDGMVYVYNNGGTLHSIVALDGNSGNKRWSYATDKVVALAVSE